MASIDIPIITLKPGVSLPAYATAGAAGLDLAAAVDAPLVLEAGGFAAVPCGFAMAIPPGYEGQIRPRSGLAARHGLTVLNAPGTIDCDYRGEVKVLLINLGREPVTLTAGLRIAQLVVAPVAHVTWDLREDLPSTERGGGGFGHTGA